MGEARRRLQAGYTPPSLPPAGAIAEAVAEMRAAQAVWREQINIPCNSSYGDCLTAAEELAKVFRELGYPAATVHGGYAVWRVGPGVADCLAFHPISTTTGGGEWMGHAWVQFGWHIVDPTTRDIAATLANLDALDGYKSNCLWAPDVLVTSRRDPAFKNHAEQVRDGFVASHFYLSVPAVLEEGYAHALGLLPSGCDGWEVRR